MADQVQEMLDVPREFLKDGIQFINRAQKRMSSFSQALTGITQKTQITNSTSSRPP